eukprot:COSAG01_NODE_992_length_12250_cov_14.174356_3_plen_99_part_00
MSLCFCCMAVYGRTQAQIAACMCETQMRLLLVSATAPFHRNIYLFPKKGDLVCFPSWLVHQVPMVEAKGKKNEARVAFAANMQFQTIDQWLRTVGTSM